MISFIEAHLNGECEDCEYDCSACYLTGICQMEVDNEKSV